MPLGWGAGWAVTEKNYIELSKSEVPIDTHWTVTVVGLIRERIGVIS